MHSVFVHEDFLETLDGLSDNMLGKLMRAFIKEALGKELPNLGPVNKVLHGLITQQNERFSEQSRKRSVTAAKNGKLGGNSKREAEQKEAKPSKVKQPEAKPSKIKQTVPTITVAKTKTLKNQMPLTHIIKSSQSSHVESVINDMTGHDMTENEIKKCVLQVKNQIEYPVLIANNKEHGELIDDVVNILTEVALTPGEQVKLSKNNKTSGRLIKSTLARLTCEHISHAILQFTGVEEPITNKKAYMLNILYNSWTEKGLHQANAESIGVAV